MIDKLGLQPGVLVRTFARGCSPPEGHKLYPYAHAPAEDTTVSVTTIGKAACLRDLHPDVVLVDEASKLSLMEAVVPMCSAPHVVFFGDHTQLTPYSFAVQ